MNMTSEKKAAREGRPFLNGTVRLEDELPRDLRDSLVRRSSRKRSVRRRRRRLRERHTDRRTAAVSVRIRCAIVRMVEPVVGVQTNLERHALGDLKILPNAQVAAQEAWTTECVAADIDP